MRKREKGKNEWSRKEGRLMEVATSEYDKSILGEARVK
jgi:hypothetical protein